MIKKLSSAQEASNSNSSALIMVGSFAPLHPGHIDAMESAERVILRLDGSLAGLVYAPNSDSYVSLKLNDKVGEWNFERRVSEFTDKESGLLTPSYVDDVTGISPPERTISEEVISTVSRQLGIRACNAILIVGSDQIHSMKAHIDENRAVCVVRPGYLSAIDEHKSQKWFRKAIKSDRLIITEHRDMVSQLSSTSIREKNNLGFAQ